MQNEIFEKYGDDPIALVQTWYEEAKSSEPNDPDAVTLATATTDGKPSLRWVLVKEINDKGFKFHTNANSQKGREIEQNPQGAMCYYWKSTRKQIRITGAIETVPQDEVERYFSSRRRLRQIGAWASKQSSPLESREALSKAVESMEEKFKDTDEIPCPDHWKGYRLVPESIEFWLSHKERLHTRFVYEKTDSNLWTARYLYP